MILMSNSSIILRFANTWAATGSRSSQCAVENRAAQVLMDKAWIYLSFSHAATQYYLSTECFIIRLCTSRSPSLSTPLLDGKAPSIQQILRRLSKRNTRRGAACYPLGNFCGLPLFYEVSCSFLQHLSRRHSQSTWESQLKIPAVRLLFPSLSRRNASIYPFSRFREARHTLCSSS